MNRNNVFRDLDPSLRKQIFHTLVIGRIRDKGKIKTEKNWLSKERSLMDYCQELNVRPTALRSFLDKTLKEKPTIKILDIGVGIGTALKELYQIYGSKLYSCGISLTRTHVPKIENYRHRVGPIESLNLESQYYDLIFSVRGGFSYTLNSFTSAETTLNALAQNGLALLQDGHLLLSKDWFRKFLKGKGFKILVTRFKNGKPAAYQFQRFTKIPLDLSLFNQKYISYLNAHKDLLMNIGLDRIANREAVNDFFQKAYEFSNYQSVLT